MKKKPSATPPAPKAEPRTRAALAFGQNLAAIRHMVHFGAREMTLVHAQAARLSEVWKTIPDLTIKANVEKVRRSVERFNKSIQPRIDRYGTANLWQVVMLVTCVEAYLQDLLSAAAAGDPKLLSKSKQRAPYAAVMAASSLDELASELRARWARKWVSKGGPALWISRLEKMGVRGYPDGIASTLELFWGIRHAVVHAAGVATADFVRRHPNAGKAVGERLRVASKDFGVFLVAMKGFVEPTDRAFLARYPSLLAEEPTTAS